jgi:hypothetical protein
MNRFIYVAAAAAVASGIAAAPAVAGLSHNPSFSHKLPVRVPSGAQTVNVSDERDLLEHPSASPSVKATRTPEAEPSDDNGQDVVDNDVDDNGVQGSQGAVEPGDDNGHDGGVVNPTTASTRQGEPEPGDDNPNRGGASSGPAAPSLAPQPVATHDAGDDNPNRGGASGGQSGGRGKN